MLHPSELRLNKRLKTTLRILVTRESASSIFSVSRAADDRYGREGAGAHLHPGLYALCITEQAAIKEGQTIYAFKRNLFRLPIPGHLPQSDAFSAVA
jgi:hypothetical protein